MMRLFIGVAIPAGVRRLIALQASSMQKFAPGKYVPADMYHITLAYIGKSDEAMYRRAIDSIKTCARCFSAHTAYTCRSFL